MVTLPYLINLSLCYVNCPSAFVYWCHLNQYILTKTNHNKQRTLPTSARSAKIAKHQPRNKAVKVVDNATGYKCEISPATNDLNVMQIPKIYIALQCMFKIFITAFMQIMNLLTRPMYLPCINVYCENKVCLRFVSMEWNLFLSDGHLKKILQLQWIATYVFHRIYGMQPYINVRSGASNFAVVTTRSLIWH